MIVKIRIPFTGKDHDDHREEKDPYSVFNIQPKGFSKRTHITFHPEQTACP